ncbi:MAG: hypothetical protein ABIJ05_04545 [Patescibacteria group bacterium]
MTQENDQGQITIFLNRRGDTQFQHIHIRERTLGVVKPLCEASNVNSEEVLKLLDKIGIFITEGPSETLEEEFGNSRKRSWITFFEGKLQDLGLIESRGHALIDCLLNDMAIREAVSKGKVSPLKQKTEFYKKLLMGKNEKRNREILSW